MIKMKIALGKICMIRNFIKVYASRGGRGFIHSWGGGMVNLRVPKCSPKRGE